MVLKNPTVPIVVSGIEPNLKMKKFIKLFPKFYFVMISELVSFKLSFISQIKK